MIIGVDLDGVLFDSEHWYRSYGELFNLRLRGVKADTSKQLDIQEKYDWTKEEFDEFLDEYLQFITEKAPLKPAAKEVIELLKKRGHHLIVITARGDLGEYEIGATDERLKKEGISFDKIFYYQHDKLARCKAEGVDVMLEDSLANVTKIANGGIKCLYFRELVVAPSNHENIIEVESWGDAYREILNLEKNSK